MKTKSIFAATAVLAGVIVTGCGSSKKVAQSNVPVVQSYVPAAQITKVVTGNICEELQEEEPVIRAVGKGSHFKEQTAKNIAEMQARAQFARALASKIKTATSEDAVGYDIYSGDEASGNSASDQGVKSNNFAQSIASEIIRNTVVIKTYKELRPNNMYDIWVCLEYKAGVSEIASSVAKKVQQRIPDEEKMKMNFEFEQYRKRVEAELEKSQQ